MTRQFEMAGNFGENEIIGLVSKIGKDRRRINAVWPVSLIESVASLNMYTAFYRNL